MEPSKRPAPESAGSQPIAALPSLACFKMILRRAADLGRITWSRNFQNACMVRGEGPGFNSVDAINVIKHGQIVRLPIYEETRRAWRCEIADSVEGCNFIVDVALDCQEDFSTSPRVTVISGFFRRGSRREVKDWSGT